MKVIRDTPLVLKFEHKSWRAALISLGLFVFLSVAVILNGEDATAMEKTGAWALIGLIGLMAVHNIEITRITFDRVTGRVRLFRRRAFGALRMSLPLSQFRGVATQVFRYKGQRQSRPLLVFQDDYETWIVLGTVVMASQPLQDVADKINAWHGVDKQSVDAVAAKARFPRPNWRYIRRRISRMIFQ